MAPMFLSRIGTVKSVPTIFCRNCKHLGPFLDKNQYI